MKGPKGEQKCTRSQSMRDLLSLLELLALLTQLALQGLSDKSDRRRQRLVPITEHVVKCFEVR